jgi:hypothetical protein
MPRRRRPWSEVLPGFAWDERMAGGRYRHVKPDGTLGKLVAARDIASAVTDISDRSARRFSDMAEAVVRGNISAADFQEAMMGELKNLYGATSALARGGYANMTPAEWGRNGGILRKEYEYLADFAQALNNEELTVAQARARAALYPGKAFSRYWDEDRRLKRAGGFTEERWRAVGDERTCTSTDGKTGCAERHAMGWVPIGTHETSPDAGDTPCLGNCRCTLEYRNQSVGE